ncbi:MAG: menaquinone biosynthesis decarboxylase [Candidatus Eremiobacteraeota bacterium]|nr:menaquinone biosynthesis decarboxylase [Candidatus Eremiobacteraeota bacterium]
MPFASLQQFTEALRAAGELHVVGASVDPHLEISAITDRVVKAGGPALLFTNVKGSRFPVLTNQFGSRRRMSIALEANDLDDVGARIRKLINLAPPDSSPIGKLRGALQFAPLRHAIPKVVRSGSVHDVVMAKPDVTALPVLTTWPLDAGPFITLPLVITKDPTTGRFNVGMYRMQIFNSTQTAMHWQRHKHGRAHAKAWGSRVPVAVAIGTEPALTYAASAPLPPMLDEFAFAGLLRGKPVELVRAKTVDLMVPAEAEFSLEGYVDNEDQRTEGPFGDHTGVYTPADRYPTFHITCITHRRNPIYAATVVGKPPMEDAWLGKATERIFLPILQAMLPEVVDMNLPVEGGFHNLAIVSIRKSYAGQAKKVMNALWGLGHMMMLTRVLIVVDADVDVQDTRATAWLVLNNLAPERDVVMMPGPVDDLDHGSYSVAYGTKVGIDATRKDASEGYPRSWPTEMVMDAATRRMVSERWHAYGLDRITKALQADGWSGQGEAAYDRLMRSNRDDAR